MGLTAADIPLVASLPILVGMSAACSGTETALFSLTNSDRTRLKRFSPRAAAEAQRLLAHPRRLLILILLLNTLVNVGFFAVAALVSQRFEDNEAAAIAINIAAFLGLLLVGEVMPKALATVHRVTFARVLAIAAGFIMRILGPLCALLDLGVVRPLSLVFRPTAAAGPPKLSADELSALLESGAERGLLAQNEQHLLSDVVQLGSVRVREVMTPRVDVRWLDHRAAPEQVAELVRACGRTRFPVCRGSLDGGVLGIIDARRLLSARAAGTLTPGSGVIALLEPVLYIPDRARMDQLLDLFRTKRIHQAMCVDEHGAITGLIQVEDAVRELVRSGSRGAGTPGESVRQVSRGRWTVPGRLSVRDWAAFFEVGGAGSHSRVSTVAGLILAELGRVPRVGDSVKLGNVELSVESIDGRVVERVGVRLMGEPGVEAVK